MSSADPNNNSNNSTENAQGPWGFYNGGAGGGMPPWMMMGPWMQCPPGAMPPPQMMMMMGQQPPQTKGQTPEEMSKQWAGYQWPGYFYGPMMMQQWNQNGQQPQMGSMGPMGPMGPMGMMGMMGMMQQKQPPAGANANGGYGFYDGNGQWQQFDASGKWLGFYDANGEWHGSGAESPQKKEKPGAKSQPVHKPEPKTKQQPEPLRKLPDVHPEPRRTPEVQPKKTQEPLRKSPDVPSEQRRLPDPIRPKSPSPEPVKKTCPRPQPEPSRKLPDVHSKQRKTPEIQPIKTSPPSLEPRKTVSPSLEPVKKTHSVQQPETSKRTFEQQPRPQPELKKTMSLSLESAKKTHPVQQPETPKRTFEPQPRPQPELKKAMSSGLEPVKKTHPVQQPEPPKRTFEPQPRQQPEPPKRRFESQPRQQPEPPKRTIEPQPRQQPELKKPISPILEPVKKTHPVQQPEIPQRTFEPQPRQQPEPPKRIPEPQPRQQPEPPKRAPEPQPRQQPEPPKRIPEVRAVHTNEIPKQPEPPRRTTESHQEPPKRSLKAGMSFSHRQYNSVSTETLANPSKNTSLYQNAGQPTLKRQSKLSVNSKNRASAMGGWGRSTGFGGTLRPQRHIKVEGVMGGGGGPEMSREESIASLKSFNTSNLVTKKSRTRAFLASTRKSMMLGSATMSTAFSDNDGRNENGDPVFHVTTYVGINLHDIRRSTWGRLETRNLMLYTKARGVRCEIILTNDPDDSSKVCDIVTAEPEIVLSVSDSNACLVIKFDEAIGLEFLSKEKADAFRNDLLSKLKRAEEVDKLKSQTKFHAMYAKTFLPPIPILQTPNIMAATQLEVFQAEKNQGKYAVTPPVAIFGSNGNDVEVGHELQQELRVTNAGNKPLHFVIDLPPYCNRFIMSTDTPEATVETGLTCSIHLKMIPLCTTVISDPIRVIVTPAHGKQTEVEVSTEVRVMDSCFVDDDAIEYEGLVGEGGFGVVAKGTLDGKTVAIKSLRDINDKNVCEDFLREISLLDALRSPYVMELYGADIHPGGISMVIEYFRLGSLANVMKDYVFTLLMKYKMLKDIAEGMRFLHSMGIVHRDLKPDNILVATLSIEAGITCKIADMGSARSIFNKQAIKDTNGLGTPIYMAPEILSNTAVYAKSADVYSFAILAVEVFNGKKPYSECEFPSSWALVNYVMSDKRPVIIDEDDIYTEILDTIFDCWSKNPNVRPCK